MRRAVKVLDASVIMGWMKMTRSWRGSAARWFGKQVVQVSQEMMKILLLTIAVVVMTE